MYKRQFLCPIDVARNDMYELGRSQRYDTKLYLFLEITSKYVGDEYI